MRDDDGAHANVDTGVVKSGGNLIVCAIESEGAERTMILWEESVAINLPSGLAAQ